jgi:predicted amidohydrolase
MAREKKPLYLNPLTLDLAWKDPEGNLARLRSQISSRLEKHPNIAPESQLFLFPELTLTGFVTENPSSFPLDPPHAHVSALRAIASEFKTAVAAGFPEENPDDPAKPYNTMLLVGPDGEPVAKYRKTHLFTWGENSEDKTYAAGDEGVVASYRGWSVGFATCFDIRFPPFFHAYAKQGVDLLLVSACWIGGPHKTYQFRTINSGHAILTQSFVAAVNRSGKDPFFEYDGAEYLFSPYGEDLYAQEPCRLDPEELAGARKLVVRPSDREAYAVSRI